MAHKIIEGAVCSKCGSDAMARPTNYGKPQHDRLWCLDCGHLQADAEIGTTICEWCQAETTKMPRHGRRTFRHKCPHGEWCPRSDKLRLHDNHYPMGGPSCCDSCRHAYWQREHARIEQAGAKANAVHS